MKRMISAMVCLAVVGCSRTPPEAVSAQGQVYYRSMPITAGTIVFAPDEERGTTGELLIAPLAADGSFHLTGATVGFYRIAIAADPAVYRSEPTAFNLYPGPPARFRDIQASGMTCEMKKGENKYQIRLDDT